ncbi:MAG: CheR family methyltransferase [Polyangiaceae bacterium]
MNAQNPRLAQQEFEALRGIISARTGIHLNASKLTLVEARLARRLRARGLSSFENYVSLLKDPSEAAEELPEMVNCITTNKTSFYRESHHFDFLANRVVPELVASGRRKIRIWSAGCSTGQEPYSIAITLRDALGSLHDWDIRILASDIDTGVLNRAQLAVYDPEELADVPSRVRPWAFEQTANGKVRVAAELRKLVTLRQINLIERPWPIRTRFDVIFCRNVVIYFARPTQEALYQGFSEQLLSHGYLVAGHSENLHSVSNLFEHAGPTVYRPRTRLSRAPRRRSLRPKVTSIVPVARERRGELALVSMVPPPERADVPIQAGGLHASTKPTRIRTLLGSCVSACLYDPVARIGGANHFMLPEGAEDASLPARFGVHAMEMLINRLMQLGAQRSRLVAKAFGASTILQNENTRIRVAQRNAEFIRDFLSTENIPLVAEKLGIAEPLFLVFETDTGRALVRTLRRDLTARVVQDERSYLTRIEHQPPATPSQDVTFF